MTDSSYRPHIDGLRALAVVSVIVFHMAENLLPNGYLGVDVFFVISGFVITGSILRQDQLSLGRTYIAFFTRRIKRLFPALFVCVFTVSIAVYYIDPMPEQSLTTGVFSLFGFANFALYNFEVDYFATASRFNAFTHTWSLGVEEQFYMIFPLIIWGLCLRHKARPTRAITMAVILISIVSATAFILTYPTDTAAAYFLTPMRVWELGVGVLAYLIPYALNRHITVPSSISTISALLLIALFLVPFDDARQATLAAVLLTAMLLRVTPTSVVAKGFAQPLIVYTGKLSYSLYLWHWPVLVIASFLPGQPLPPLLLACVFILFSVASYSFIEKPLRYQTWPRVIKLLASGFVGFILIGSVTVARSEENYFARHSNFPPAWPRLIPSGKAFPRYCALDAKEARLSLETFDFCTLSPVPENDASTIWALGDSHAAHLLSLLYDLRASDGVGTHLLLSPGNTFPPTNWDEANQSVQVYREVLERALPDDILLIARLYFGRAQHMQPSSTLAGWFGDVERVASEVRESGINVVVFAPLPMFRYEDIRDCFNPGREMCSEDRKFQAEAINTITGQLHSLAQSYENLYVFEPFPIICPPSQEQCAPMARQFLYRDEDHLNAAGASLLSPAFLEYLKKEDLL